MKMTITWERRKSIAGDTYYKSSDGKFLLYRFDSNTWTIMEWISEAYAQMQPGLIYSGYKAVDDGIKLLKDAKRYTEERLEG